MEQNQIAASPVICTLFLVIISGGQTPEGEES